MKKLGLPLIAALIPALAILVCAITFSVVQAKDCFDELTSLEDVSVFPGEYTFHCPTAEPQVIWLYESILYEGRQYTTDRLPEGTTLKVWSVDGREDVEVTNPGGSMTKNSGGMSARVIARFTPPHPGDYVLSVSGDSKKFILQVGPDDFMDTLMKIFTAVLVLLGGLVGAAGVFVAVFFILRARISKKAGPPPLTRA
ncbi:MAG: hypothetical protein ACQKBW_01270 [Puniceicoccales bacterium]